MTKSLYREPCGHVSYYDQEPSTRNILAEVDFIERVIGFDQAKLILDLGRDVGERSLELARRGYLVVGLDPHETRLEEARKRAEAEHLGVQFVRGHAHSLVYRCQFDVALLHMACGEREERVLKKVCRALKPKGALMLTVSNLACGLDDFDPRPQGEPVSRTELAELGFIVSESFVVGERGFKRDAPPSARDLAFGLIAVKDGCAAVSPSISGFFQHYNGAKEER